MPRLTTIGALRWLPSVNMRPPSPTTIRRSAFSPAYAQAYNNRGVAQAKLGRHGAAIGDYDQAIRLQPESAEPYYNRGAAKERLGQFEEAIADYDQAILVQPDDVEAYRNRAVAKAALGRTAEARADFAAALEASAGGN